MDQFMAALTSGLAVAQAAQGAQSNLATAGQRPPFFVVRVQPDWDRYAPPAGAPRVENGLFDPPNAIMVGASSDLERISSLNPYAPAVAR